VTIPDAKPIWQQFLTKLYLFCNFQDISPVVRKKMLIACVLGKYCERLHRLEGNVSWMFVVSGPRHRESSTSICCGPMLQMVSTGRFSTGIIKIQYPVLLDNSAFMQK
jgi:hypothetical protein